MRAAGASRLQALRFGVLPQIAPVMLSHALYYFESNTRSATILGVVGASRIGYQLMERIRINRWDEVAVRRSEEDGVQMNASAAATLPRSASRRVTRPVSIESNVGAGEGLVVVSS